MKSFARKILLLIFLTELASYLGFFFPAFANVVFVVAVIAAAVAVLSKLEYGLYIMVGDLLLGSKSGALVALSVGNFFLSFRMAFFVIFLSAWLLVLWRERRWPRFFSDRLVWAYGALGLVFIIGIIRGLTLANSPADIFFDANAFIYFLLVFPVYEIIRDATVTQKLFRLIGIGISWLLLKSLLVLYFFSHAIMGPREDLYHWMSDTATGQVAWIGGRFYRVFLQSQIWAVVGLFIFGLYLVLASDRTKSFRQRLFDLVGRYHKESALFMISLLVVIISFSRSIWLGVGVAAVVMAIFLIWSRQMRVREMLLAAVAVFILLAASWSAIQGVVDFPWPRVSLDAGNALRDRLSDLLGQAGGSTRLNQLNPLWIGIQQHPWLGAGFGKELTYLTTDPKNLLETVQGQFTTYAFEWGWLDLWLKLGFAGVLAYAILIGILAKRLWQQAVLATMTETRAWWWGWLGVLLVLTIIHITTPYLNHPLGIGMVILISAITFVEKSEARNPKFETN